MYCWRWAWLQRNLANCRPSHDRISANHSMKAERLVSIATRKVESCQSPSTPWRSGPMPGTSVGVALAHHIAAATGFVGVVTHRIPGGNPQFAQQQNRRGGKIFTVPAAAGQEESRERRSIVGGVIRTLPGAVGELSEKESFHGQFFLLIAGRCRKVQFSHNTFQGLGFSGGKAKSSWLVDRSGGKSMVASEQ